MSITESTSEIRALAREFAANELRPHVEHWDHERALDASALQHVAELGFFGMLAPEAHGGMGMDLPSYVAALEELAWGEPAVALTVAVHTSVLAALAAHGTDAQKTQWLEGLARAEPLACMALAGADEGDDASITIKARQSSGDWTLSGEAPWVTNARTAGLALIVAQNGVFLVATDNKGFAVGVRADTMGFRALDIAPVTVRELRIGAAVLPGGG